MDTGIRESESITVTVRESDLLEAYIVALESGEFRQIRDRLMDRRNGRCALGVAYDVMDRAHEPYWHDAIMLAALNRACVILGYPGVDAANDAGVSFAHIAQALRQAREEMGGGS